jgi:hypothetical protein
MRVTVDEAGNHGAAAGIESQRGPGVAVEARNHISVKPQGARIRAHLRGAVQPQVVQAIARRAQDLRGSVDADAAHALAASGSSIGIFRLDRSAQRMASS